MDEKNKIDMLIEQYINSPVTEKGIIENSICEECTPLVYKIANKYKKSIMTDGANIQDNVQNGYLGLIQAIRTYDPGSNVKFLTYAFICVQKAVFWGVRDINTVGKSKAYTYSKLQKYKKAKAELILQFGRVPSVREISLKTGDKINTVLTYELHLSDTLSVDTLQIFDGSI